MSREDGLDGATNNVNACPQRTQCMSCSRILVHLVALSDVHLGVVDVSVGATLAKRFFASTGVCSEACYGLSFTTRVVEAEREETKVVEGGTAIIIDLLTASARCPEGVEGGGHPTLRSVYSPVHLESL